MVIAGVVSAMVVAVVVAGLAIWTRWSWVVVDVQGHSMLPTFQDGSRVITRRRSGEAVSVGDIVVFESPGLTHNGSRVSDPEGILPRWLIKRVVAVPGDAVPAGVRTAVGVDMVPPGALVVLGDSNGFDSRSFGLLKFDRVLGVVVRPVVNRP
ncbi:S26 family signal peptidase [Micromonospora musae]|uniref:S26 family signal peptidase n=1 Tax=Micromonospora musae TaxID=1894970 RepID=UPI00343B9B8A